MANPVNGAYVTLLTKTAYLPGALIMDYTFRSVGSRYPLIIMVTPQLPQDARDSLQRRGIPMREVEYLTPDMDKHVLSDHDKRFADTWTKLRAFDLQEYERVVLVDSDMIVRRNMDELMEMDLPKDWIAAVHACACNPRKLPHYPKDWVPANCAYTPLVHPGALDSPSAITNTTPRPYGLLNSGLVVLNPSHDLMSSITNYLSTSPDVPNFSFPDQDLLAAFFKGRWKPLPWKYNALKTLRVIHKPLWRDEEIRCLHYILHDKPWQTRVGEPGTGGEYEQVNRWWWAALDKVLDDLAGDDETRKLVLANVASA